MGAVDLLIATLMIILGYIAMAYFHELWPWHKDDKSHDKR
jgi:hypothetical protein